MFISLSQEMDVDRLIRLRPQLVFLIRLLQRSLPSIDSQLTYPTIQDMKGRQNTELGN